MAFGEPYEFRGVKFYPVSLKYLIEFYACCDVLIYHQEWVRERELAGLPYLWFLVYAFIHHKEYEDKPEYQTFIPRLYALLELTARTKNIRVEPKFKDDGSGLKSCNLFIDDVEFISSDFDQIRRLIMEQAGIEHNWDQFIHEDAWKAMEAGRQYENKERNYVPPSLENLIDILSMYLHKTTEEIIDSFTIRKFNNIIRYMGSFEEWKLLRGGEASGMVTYKRPIPHWIRGFDKFDVFRNENINYMDNYANINN